jgi:hypothetical protein
MPGRADLTLRHRSAAALALALASIVSTGAPGCAGDPDVELPGPDSPTAPLTKVQYTVRANEICRATTRAVAERTDEVGSAELDAGSGGDRAALREAIEPITGLAIRRLRNLTPPPADAALVRSGIDAMQAAADAARTDPQAPLDPVGLNRPELFDYGLTACFSKR